MLEVRKGKKKNWKREAGEMGNLECPLEVGGSHKKMGEKNGEEEKSRQGLGRVGVRRESGKRKKMKRGMGR